LKRSIKVACAISTDVVLIDLYCCLAQHHQTSRLVAGTGSSRSSPHVYGQLPPNAYDGLFPNFDDQAHHAMHIKQAVQNCFQLLNC
jgi:hypothetical protein